VIGEKARYLYCNEQIRFGISCLYVSSIGPSGLFQIRINFWNFEFF